MTAPHSASAAQLPATTPPSPPWLTLALLTLVFAVNQLDRGIVAILLPSIKAEMHLSDTRLALLAGVSFALIYAAASIPIGRLADRYNRPRIVGVGVILYSLMTAAMGASQTFAQLLLCRSAVAIGEATGNAPSSTLISDTYPPERRPRALAIWSAGSYLGLFAGLTAGGWLVAHHGWRVALWSISIPGLAVGIACLTAVPEPRESAAKDRTPAEPFGRVLAELLKLRAFVWLFIAMVVSGIVAYSVQVWTPSILSRSQGFSASQIGFFSGLFKGALGLCGILAGGYLSQSLLRGRVGRLAWVPTGTSLLVPIALTVFIVAPQPSLSLIALGLASFLIPAYQGPAMALVHAVVPQARRSFGTTLILAGVTLGGLGLGPLMVGMLSDMLTPAFGKEALRYAFAIVALLPFGAAFAFWRAAAYAQEDAAASAL
ncbi:MAG: transporter [Alphaproteobacteria bacterium]|nr:transporter [Alphaproteobacteria bacterium]